MNLIHVIKARFSSKKKKANDLYCNHDLQASLTKMLQEDELVIPKELKAFLTEKLA